MYILDEPSIGLHQRDNDRLLKTLTFLRDLGNTVIVVEHDEDAIYAADFIVDIGPGAGVHGGEIVATGTASEIASCAHSITGQYLCGTRGIEIPAKRTPARQNKFIRINGASSNNLKAVNLELPIGLFTCITGVSGSGKSTLINETLYKLAAIEIYGSNFSTGSYESFSGLDKFDKVIDINQSPIGRTPRSNPATYTGLFTPIRELFAGTQEARSRGYKPGRFSFNVKGGRCEACQGECTFCPTSTSPAISARANATTARRSTSPTRASRFTRYWR
jgi:excinuclease ABC subunit A